MDIAYVNRSSLAPKVSFPLALELFEPASEANSSRGKFSACGTCSSNAHPGMSVSSLNSTPQQAPPDEGRWR
jgi:hypothetical protein